MYDIIYRQFKGGADLALARFTVVKCFFPGPGDTSRTAYTGVNSRNVAAEGKNVFLHFFVVSCANNEYMSHMPAVTRHKKCLGHVLQYALKECDPKCPVW